MKAVSLFFKRLWVGSDKLLILFCILASTYGCALVYSATHLTDTAHRSFTMQWAASAIGLILAILISQVDYEKICALWPVWAGISLILVGLTFTPLGLAVPGTDDKAWINIPLGPMSTTFQPSELMKIVFIITFSKHLSVVRDRLNQLSTLVLVGLHGLLPIGLVMAQGDDGTALVFICMFVAMLFAAGLKSLYMAIGATAVVAMVPVGWMLLDEQKTARILALIYPEEYRQTVGWQQALGLQAIGSGQLNGRGFLQGASQGLYARNNDFIFTVAGEEFGFIGSMLLLMILVGILLLMLRNVLRARDSLGMYIAVGMMSLVGFQSIINLGMNVRLLPVIGITLPFFSAGGSSVLTLYLGIGLVLSVCYSSRMKSPQSIFSKKV